MGAKFTVDTHVFRELGELLVGRDSTALIELIKNAYDADALEVKSTSWSSVYHGRSLFFFGTQPPASATAFDISSGDILAFRKINSAPALSLPRSAAKLKYS
jgi:hypothetical protein